MSNVRTTVPTRTLALKAPLRLMRWFYWLALIQLMCSMSAHGAWSDYTVLSINLLANTTDAVTGAVTEVKAVFLLRYGVVAAGGWRRAVEEDLRSTPFAADTDQVNAYIESELTRQGFHPDVIHTDMPLLEAESLLAADIYSHGALHQLMHSAAAAALPMLVREQSGTDDDGNASSGRSKRTAVGRRRGRALFTARREVGAASNPFDDAQVRLGPPGNAPWALTSRHLNPFDDTQQVVAEMNGGGEGAGGGRGGAGTGAEAAASTEDVAWARPSVLPLFLRYPDPPPPFRPPRILIYQVTLPRRC